MLAGVPLWQGTQDAIHSAEDLRMMTYMMMRGNEGFLTNSGGKARPLDIPGGGIIVSNGPFVVNSQFPGGALQAYMTRIISDHQVDLVPNSTSSTTYDLVVCNIEDPAPSGGTVWPYPGDIGTDARKYGPYWNIKVIQNVPSTVVCLDDLPTNRPERNWTAIPVCLLTRAPNSNFITAANIKQLGITCNPFNGLGVPASLYQNIAFVDGVVSDLLSGRIQIPGTFTNSVDCTVATDGSNTLAPTQTTWKRFPKESLWTPLIPPWATFAETFVIAVGIGQKPLSTGADGHVYGATRIKLGNWSASNQRQYDIDDVASADSRPISNGDYIGYDNTKRPTPRINLICTDTFPIDSRDRNKKSTVEFQAASFNDPKAKGKLIADQFSGVYIGIKFKETP